jgi:hypothetical protein
MIIQIIPYHKERLSQTAFGKDELVFRMNPNPVVRSSVTGLTLLEKNLIEREYRYPIFPTYANAESMEQSFNTATNFAIAL